MRTPGDDSLPLRGLAAGAVMAGGANVVPLIRRGTRLILLLLWTLATVAAVFSGWLLLHHARTHTEATAFSLEQAARRTITLAAFVVEEYEEFLDARGGVAGLAEDPASAEKLRSLSKWLPLDSAVGLALPDGAWAVSTGPLSSPPAKLSDQRWFQAHVRDGRQTYVGPAILNPVSKRHVFTFSASYRPADGPLLGIINVGIPSNSITGLAADEHHTNMALVQHDGAVVAAQPFSPGLVDKSFTFPGTPPDSQETTYGTVFDEWSVATIRNVPDLGLYAVVALPILDVLQPLLWGVGLGLPLLLLLTSLLHSMSNQLQAKSQQVEQALADNRVLFQEVHHRVKNNLQVVSSLLRLQIERLPPELRPLMEETGSRVRAIALVHEQIYRTASPAVVQLDPFLKELVQQLSASMIGGTAKIETDLQPVTIGLDRAVPVAILATEAITNAIKHGLTGGDGVITVSLASAGGRNVLEVRDSGSGPAGDGKAGLGTRIMTALARQIDGAWSLGTTSSGGTTFTVDWPAEA